MAVGKSTVGRHLADVLELPFFDTDHEIEARAGADISWIFDMEGEQGFRDREEQVIEELTRMHGIVLATGGGAVLREANRQHLHDRGIVIHLDMNIDRLVERTAKDKKRPLLQSADPKTVFQRLQQERGPLYEAVRHYCFAPPRGSARHVAERIVRRLREDGALPWSA